MASKNPNDFRRAAVLESQRLFELSGLSNPLNSETSLCLPNDGDATGSLYRIALVPWLFLLPGLLLILSGIIYGILIFTPWVDFSFQSSGIMIGTVVIGGVITYFGFSIADRILDRAILHWNGPRLVNELASRVTECCEFAIEDPATYLKQKLISEDYAKGGLDRSGYGLLLAGCQYQYIIRPQDVTELRENKKVFLATIRIRTASLTLAIRPLLGDFDKEKPFFDSIRTALRPTVPGGV